MGGLEIGLLAAGIICFVLSFFLSEKLSSSDINEFEKVSKAEINAIVEKQLRQADNGIKIMIDEGMKDAMEDFDGKTDKLLNTKIMSISDYSDSVLTSMEKSHKEVLFMYNMMLEKQEALTELTKEIQMLQSNLREIKANIAEDIENQQFQTITESLERIEPIDMIEAHVVNTESIPMEAALTEEVAPEHITEDIKNQNAKIIKMHNEGFNEVEIAKRLGRGLGEVKLVLGLFNKE